jgi:type I restriction enzyme M protein
MAIKNKSLEDSANLPEPSVLALEVAEELDAALEQFATIAEDLKLHINIRKENDAIKVD